MICLVAVVTGRKFDTYLIIILHIIANALTWQNGHVGAKTIGKNLAQDLHNNRIKFLPWRQVQ